MVLLFYYASAFCKCRKWIPLESVLPLQECIQSLIGYINLHKCHHLSSVIAQWRCICPVSHILVRSCDYSLKLHLSWSGSSRLWEVVFPEHPVKAICLQNNYSSPEGLLIPAAKPWQQASTVPHGGSCVLHVGFLPCCSLCLCLVLAVYPLGLCLDAAFPGSHFCPPEARRHGPIWQSHILLYFPT